MSMRLSIYEVNAESCNGLTHVSGRLYCDHVLNDESARVCRDPPVARPRRSSTFDICPPRERPAFVSHSLRRFGDEFCNVSFVLGSRTFIRHTCILAKVVRSELSKVSFLHSSMSVVVFSLTPLLCPSFPLRSSQIRGAPRRAGACWGLPTTLVADVTATYETDSLTQGPRRTAGGGLI
ncbi:hypothetical protein EVAR_95201_1 [Eumeta japonica]|uniref:Uncharacterized protein n=1 Tax=Eumeta variegata TaxID=151549 RepID=A0A4C1VJH8_EUMVA|nr:hypothetical protein EVAR_95201_1 [Eumeta japonica]